LLGSLGIQNKSAAFTNAALFNLGCSQASTASGRIVLDNDMLTASKRIVLARWTFAFTAVVVFVLATLPGAYDPVHIWDKAKHFSAFFVLTGLAVLSFPDRRLLGIGICLSGFGAFIEVVQGLPMVHRDANVWDWVADTLAVATLLAIAAQQRLRQRRPAL
jgi:VanZ family protein